MSIEHLRRRHRVFRRSTTENELSSTLTRFGSEASRRPKVISNSRGVKHKCVTWSRITKCCHQQFQLDLRAMASLDLQQSFCMNIKTSVFYQLYRGGGRRFRIASVQS